MNEKHLELEKLFGRLRESMTAEELGGVSTMDATVEELLEPDEEAERQDAGSVGTLYRSQPPAKAQDEAASLFEQLIGNMVTHLRTLGSGFATTDIPIPLGKQLHPIEVQLRRSELVQLQVYTHGDEPLELVILDMYDFDPNTLFYPDHNLIGPEQRSFQLPFRAPKAAGSYTSVVLVFAGRAPPRETLLRLPVECLGEYGLRHRWAYTLVVS
ncbi:hypothetical protein ACLESO_24755 [Pyxidicoccus sp. 3LG]